MERTSWKPLAGSLSVILAFGLSFWWFSRRESGSRSAPAVPESSLRAVPQNPAHERAALVDQLKKKPDHGPVLLRLAQLDLDSGKPADARKWLEELLTAEPDNLDARLELSRACYEAGDVPCSEVQTRKILEKDPGQVDALYNLGAIAANQGRFEVARDYWGRAVRSAPQSASGQKAEQGLSALQKR